MRKMAAVMACGLLAGCSMNKDIFAADAGISKFHQDLNAARFDEIYTESGAELSTTQAALIQFLSAVHRKLGNFQSGSSTSWNDNVTTTGHFVTIGYSAKYDRGGADENFVYRIDGPRAILAGYHVNSTALVVN
jgi:hypothetical protein